MQPESHDKAYHWDMPQTVEEARVLFHGLTFANTEHR
jgi:hypothetical protein